MCLLQLEKAKREAGILKTLDHPNIIKLYDFFISPTSIYLVLEYVELTLLHIIQTEKLLDE